MKKYSPARVNVYWKLWPGFNLGLNKPSKNCVAQCGFRLGKLGNVAAQRVFVLEAGHEIPHV